MTTNLEELVVENRRNYSDDLRGARNMPRDNAATEDFKSDPDKMAQLAELADVEAEQIVDVAIRGGNVSFQVADEDGVVSPGFFPTAALSDKSSAKAKKARKKGGVRDRSGGDPAPAGGTAAVASVATTGGDDPKTQQEADDARREPVEGLPPNIGEMSGTDVAALLKDTPEGVDVGKVLEHEWAREGGPRTAVGRAAKQLDLLDEEGKPKGAEGPPPPP